jgi:hypothetical protein
MLNHGAERSQHNIFYVEPQEMILAVEQLFIEWHVSLGKNPDSFELAACITEVFKNKQLDGLPANHIVFATLLSQLVDEYAALGYDLFSLSDIFSSFLFEGETWQDYVQQQVALNRSRKEIVISILTIKVVKQSVSYKDLCISVITDILLEQQRK